jgi:hypothetical protein
LEHEPVTGAEATASRLASLEGHAASRFAYWVLQIDRTFAIKAIEIPLICVGIIRE